MLENHSMKDMHPFAELHTIVEEFRHLRAELQREGEDGSWRRHIGRRMDELEERFTVILARWIPEAEVREQWRACMHHGARFPVEPPREMPPLYRGRSDNGSMIIIRESAGMLAVIIDGQPLVRLPPSQEIGSMFRVSNNEFHENTEAPAAAVEALAGYVEAGEDEPPWQWAPALFDDGLIDANFALTPRGQRILTSLPER